MTLLRERPAVSSPSAPARAPRRSYAVFPVHLAMLAWAVVTALPLIWAVVSSFKTDTEILNEPWSLPASPQPGNWARAWTEASIGRYFLNSLIVVGGALLLTMLLGSLVAYALARYEFRGNRLIYYTFVAAMFFPVFLALVPLFFVVQQLGLLGTYQGLILVYAAYAVPFTVFFLHSFFRTLPSEIAEAAFLDGCSHGAVFFRVMLPLAGPVTATVVVLTFLTTWNAFFLPLVFTFSRPDLRTLSVGMQAFVGENSVDWPGMAAAATLSLLPIVALFLFLQRYFFEGIAGAVKS